MPGDGLHGRDAELEAIAGVLDAVARGGRRLLAVRGEAGIGKTRLLAELRKRAEAQRFVVLESRASELEQDIPLVPVIDALAPRLPPADGLAALGPERLGLLAGLLPGVAAPAGVATGGERWRLYRALGELLELIAGGRPLLLLVDDLHWADAATQELLQQLVRRPPADSLLIACGARPGPPGERLLAAQRASGAVGLVALDLVALDRAAAESLLAGVPAGSERDRCFVQSGGNPLLLRELARDGGRHPVPGGIVAAMRLEVGSLPADASALVQAAAVTGDPFDFDLAAEVAGLDEATALRALDTLATSELVRATDDPRRFAFRHPIVRSAVYEALGAGARLAGHAAAARSLAAADAPLAGRAHHLAYAATPGDIMAAALLAAAAAEVRPRAPGVAADWLLAARRADPTSVAPAILAETLVEAGRLAAALDVADASAATADVRLALTAASIERSLGRHDAAGRRLLQALATTAPDSAEAALLRVDLAVGAYQRGDYAETRSWAQQVGTELTDGTNAVRATAAAMLAVGDASAGDATAAAAGVAAAVLALEQSSDDELGAVAEPAMAISWGLLALDRLPEGLAAARRIAAAARDAGRGPAAVPHDLAAVLALGLLGRMTEAEPAADEAEQAARVSANPQLVQWALWLRAWVLMERGQIDPAFAAASESVALAGELDDSASGIVARAVLGAILAAREEPARGRELLAAYDIDHGWICRWAPVLVECDLALGDLAAANEHAGRASDLAPGTGMAGARAAAQRAQALVALADGDATGAARLALGAAAEAASAGAALEAARGQLLAGRALLAGDRDAAIAALTAAGELATHCGAERVADQARMELRRAGVRVGSGGARAERGSGLSALTRREREIADLVAAGLTNREIGARLYLSEKTIETHLTRVFQKLGVRSRTQAAALLGPSMPRELRTP
jgi:DNA-binding NarL/FixJ family response regulator